MAKFGPPLTHRVRSKESDTSPVDRSYSSVTFMNANAAISAAMEIRNELLEATSEITGSKIEGLIG